MFATSTSLITNLDVYKYIVNVSPRIGEASVGSSPNVVLRLFSAISAYSVLLKSFLSITFLVFYRKVVFSQLTLLKIYLTLLACHLVLALI